MQASCAPVTYSLTGLPNGVTGKLVPSNKISTPPFKVDVNLTIDSSKPPKPGHDSYTLNASSPTCGTLAPGTGSYYILCSLSLKNCPELEIADHNKSDAVLSGIQKSVVGHQANLITEVKAGTGTGSYTISNALWTVDPNAITAYARAGAAATTLVSPTFTTNVSTYWIDGGTKNVSVDSEADRSDGQEISIPHAQLVYSVGVPTYSITLTTPSSPGIYVGTRTDFPGQLLTWGSSKSFPGIIFQYNVTNDKGFAGSTAMTQLINRVITVNSNPVNVTSPNPPWLDNTVDYAGVVQPTGTVVSVADAPGLVLKNTYTTAIMADSFYDYFMYKPNDHGIWVTLATASWAWNAGATIVDVKNNKWCLDGVTGCPNSTPKATHTNNPPASASSTLPTWGGIYHGSQPALEAYLLAGGASKGQWLITPIADP